MNFRYAHVLLVLMSLFVATAGASAEETPPTEAAALNEAALLSEAAPAPDEVALTNGSRILGTVTTVRDGVVTVETDFAGTLEIPVDMVASMQTANPVVMQMADESVIENQPLVINNDQLVVGGASPLPLEDLLVVNPEPWELGYGYKWTGLASFAFAVERGNTKTDELDYRLESVWRSDDDRYTLKAFGNVDKANDVKNADNWVVNGKYDYFLEGPNFWGVNAYAESDEFADLDLRWYVGPYIGRELYTEPVFMFEAMIGISYVSEDFIVAEDNDYPGANWELHMSSDYLGGDSRLYFDQLGILNLDEASDVVINNTFGLAFPLLFGLEAAAEVRLDYNSGAVAGVDKLDERYALRIGYTW